MAEQRLPSVGGDDGQWGTILNQYLELQHVNTGSDDPGNGGHQKVTITAGTATAGTAPLKFTSGTVLSSPEVGAMEFNSDSLYFTTTTGPTRKTIAWTDGSNSSFFVQGGNSFGTTAVIGTNDANDLHIETSGSTKLTVESGGNVGIGTTDPQRALHIVGTDGAVDTFPAIVGAKDFLLVENNGNANMGFIADQSAASSIKFYDDGASNFEGIIEYSYANDGLGFGANQSGGVVNYQLYISSAGQVGVGTTSPSTLLHVGLAGTTLGTLGLAGDTSGLVTIQPASAAGTWTLTLPTDDGDAGQFLQTDGSGVTSWVDAGGGASSTDYTHAMLLGGM